MSIFAPLAIFGWPFVVLALFLYLPAQRAVLCSMLGAWMFLPIASYSLPGIPDLTKMSVTCVSVLLATAIFEPGRLSQFRWCWGDIFVLMWIISPIPSCAFSPYGLYEGVSSSLGHVIGWGLPYIIGRVYFSRFDALNEVAKLFFFAGLVYVPFVLFEVRMSPQLHAWIYGYYQHSFDQTYRLGGWRPTVFMQHGLAVATFMATSSVCGGYLAFWRRIKLPFSIPAWTGILGVVVGTLLCKSAYAILLMISGTSTLLASAMMRSKLLLLTLCLITPTYMFARTYGGWDAQILRQIALQFGDDRADSLELRLSSEETLWRWLQGNRLFGRARLEELMTSPREDLGRFVPDGFWLIALGKFGMVGLVSVFGALLAPPLIYLIRFRTQKLLSPQQSGATSLCLIIILYTMDNLLNAMLNPMYLLAAGGLIAVREDGFRNTSS